VISSRVIPGKPEISKLLIHRWPRPRRRPHHDGGKHWTSKERSRVADAGGVGPRRDAASGGATSVGIGQGPHHPDQLGGDNVHIIDPVTNTVVGQ
jgi:hypothetical protein